jgi:hypothetical protein
MAVAWAPTEKLAAEKRPISSGDCMDCPDDGVGVVMADDANRLCFASYWNKLECIWLLGQQLSMIDALRLTFFSVGNLIGLMC